VHRIADKYRVRPGRAVDLGRVDPASTTGATKAVAARDVAAMTKQLAALHDRLFAQGTQSLLVVLQALDAGGKDGTIRHLLTGLNPQGVKITGFKTPTPNEQAHDFLWRVHAAAPAAGEIGVFNRSHYEDVVAARVRGTMPRATGALWSARYEHIRHFEALLRNGGTTVVKFFLHISRDEQRRRFEARLHDPTKQWKFRPADLDDRAKWDEYQRVYGEAIGKTATKDGPWYVVPADHKWYRNRIVSEVLVATLEAMDPQFPEPPDLKGITIPH